jgi:hypothetical protein
VRGSKGESQSLPVSEPPKTPTQPIVIILSRLDFGRWTGLGQGDLEGSLDRLDLLGVTEIRRPAAGPRLDEGGDALGLAGEVGVGFEGGEILIVYESCT